MATSEDFASAAAVAGFCPESNFTSADGTFAFTAFSGEVGNQICSSHSGLFPP